MSPRRKFSPGEAPLLSEQPLPPGRDRRLPVVGAVAAVLMVAAITVCTLMLISHEARVTTASKNREVLSYVTGFMTGFTSLDPFHANDYVLRVQGDATGDFAKEYQDKANEILLQVARAEPATGSVLDAGVERWNDDGSANVIVATLVTSKSPDGKRVFENTTRWMATATREGNRWKISNLTTVV
ncbi:mammalian cell entry protein [Mycobacterium rhizamassiliense]|uniref:Mammalian cell entry protein n=1 Tax=Mycobacterium rhizamassiliense TaxID=1841860 RepID=A0A2U3NPF2_9MYCO|nr:mammalian cell entry protein [Mycobacterium rhizamassiliense]SPM33408.1 mammalian cell entry protein [Mycobacterium rhizamassiliense]